MTNSNKILLVALLQIEASLYQTNTYLKQISIPISIQLDFSKIHDLFSTIITAFSIPEENYEKLYNILEKLSNPKILLSEIITEIELLIS